MTGKGGRSGAKHGLRSSQSWPEEGGEEGWGQDLWRSCPTRAKELGFVPRSRSLASGGGAAGIGDITLHILADMVAIGGALPQVGPAPGGITCGLNVSPGVRTSSLAS